MKETTAFKYFQQWKKLGPNFEKRYAYVKELLNPLAPDRYRTLELFAKWCGITKEELEKILSQPHGLRRLLTGKFYFPAHEYADRKRQIALEVALTIYDYLIREGGNIEDVRFAFEHWMKENHKYSKAEDADIEEEKMLIDYLMSGKQSYGEVYLFHNFKRRFEKFIKQLHQSGYSGKISSL